MTAEIFTMGTGPISGLGPHRKEGRVLPLRRAPTAILLESSPWRMD
jgi:hypothetical protein